MTLLGNKNKGLCKFKKIILKCLKEEAEKIELVLEDLLSQITTDHLKLNDEDQFDFICHIRDDGEFLHDQLWNPHSLIYSFDEANGTYKLIGTDKKIKRAKKKLLKNLAMLLTIAEIDLIKHFVITDQLLEYIKMVNKQNKNQVYLKLMVSCTNVTFDIAFYTLFETLPNHSFNVIA